MEDQDKINKLIYSILWEMEYFGDFGNRQDYIESQIKTLKELLNKTED
jgi:hypothetical protein